VHGALPQLPLFRLHFVRVPLRCVCVCPFSCRQALGVLSYLQEIAPGVVQCQVPPHKPGIVYFWLACIEEGSDTVDLTALPKEGDTVQYSQPVPFYYAPMDPAGTSTSPSSPSHCASLHWGLTRWAHRTLVSGLGAGRPQ
jgi:hypothetical protein